MTTLTVDYNNTVINIRNVETRNVNASATVNGLFALNRVIATIREAQSLYNNAMGDAIVTAYTLQPKDGLLSNNDTRIHELVVRTLPFLVEYC